MSAAAADAHLPLQAMMSRAALVATGAMAALGGLGEGPNDPPGGKQPEGLESPFFRCGKLRRTARCTGMCGFA